MNNYAPPLQGTADNLAQYGRYGDSMLVHMNPIEVQGIAALSPTGRLTTNPVTGQQEAFLPFLAPLLGSWLGLGAGGSALLSGALTWAKTGDLGKGILGGLTSFGMGKILDAIPSSVDVDVPGVLPDATDATAALTDVTADTVTAIPEDLMGDILTETANPSDALFAGVDSTLGSNVFGTGAAGTAGAGAAGAGAAGADETLGLLGRGFTRDGRIDWSRAGELDFSKDVAGNLILSSAAGAELGRLDALEDLEKTQAGLDADREASLAESEEDYERAMRQIVYDYGWPERGIKPRDPIYAPTGYGAIPMFAAGGGLISLNPSDYNNKREGLARLMGEPVRMNGGGMLMNDGDFYNDSWFADPYYGNPSFLDTRSMSAAQAQGALRGPQVISADQMRQLAAAGHRPGIDPEIQFFRQPEEFPSFLDPLNPNVPPPPSPDDEAPPDIILDPVTTDPVTTDPVTTDPVTILPNLGGIGRGFNFGNIDYPDDEGDMNWWENLDDRNVVEGEVSPPAVTPPPGTFRIPDAVAPPIASRPAQLAVPPVPALTVAPPVVPPMPGRARRYADLIKRNAPPAPQPPPMPPAAVAPPAVVPPPPVMGPPPSLPMVPPPPPAMPPMPPMPPPQVAPPMAARPPVVPRIPSPSPVVVPPPPAPPVAAPQPSVADWSEHGGWSGLPSIAAVQKAAPKAKAKKKTKKESKKKAKKGSSGRGRKHEGGLIKMQDMGQVPEMESGIASVDPAMGDMDAEAMQLVELTAMAVLGQIPAEQADPIIQAFIQQFGPEAFQMLRQQVLASVEPGAQTEGMIQGQGDGMSDEIMGSIGDQQRVAVSPGEYIVPADVVSGIGNGSSDAGAGELDRMMSDIRQARTGMTEQPPEINPRTAMPV